MNCLLRSINLFARRLGGRAVLAVLAFMMVAATAAPAQAEETLIRRVRGVDHSAKVNGWVTIGAWVQGDPHQVIFALSGPVSRTSVRTESPYYFLENRKGEPRAWNTSNAPEGQYTLRVKAVRDNQVVDSVTVEFEVDHKAPKQNKLKKSQKAKTPLRSSAIIDNNEQDDSEIVVPDNGSADEVTSNDPGDGGTPKPVINFASNTEDVYEHGSGESIRVTVQGTIPSNGDILAIAWNDDEKKLVNSFAHTLNNNNPVLTAKKLDTLPDGRIQIQLLYREDSVVQYRKLHMFEMVTIGSEEEGDDEPAPIEKALISSVSGFNGTDALSGIADIQVTTSGATPEEVYFVLDGPEELVWSDRDAPFMFLGDTWNTAKHANGEYTMTITAFVDDTQTDTRTIRFDIQNEVIVPDPVVAFKSSTPTAYQQGSGQDIAFNVDRELPQNASVLVLAWSAATWDIVGEFSHHIKQGPWKISASKLDMLPEGRTELQLLYFADNKDVYKRTHIIEMVGVPSDDTVADGNDNGSGNSGTIDDDTTNTGSENNDDSTVDNGGQDNGSGNDAGNGDSTADGSDDTNNDDSQTDDDTASNNDPPDTVLTPGQQPILGMNLSFVTYWTREWVFVDVMRQCREWLPTNTGGQPWDSGDHIQVDSNGWPLLESGKAAATVTLNGMNGRYPSGKYICTYEGEGDVIFEWDAKVTKREPGYLEVDVNPSDAGIYMRIENSNPSNHVRNVTLKHEDLVDHPSSFHPLFVERLKPFKTLRFMDWQRTNTTKQVNWSDRITPDDYTQGSNGGVAIELMIELANELGADPWFCMPAQANDDYVRRFAQKVKNRLHTDAKVYVEWSNEVWNSQFEVHKWIKSVTDDRSLSMPFFDKWASEARRDFSIWSDVWSDDSGRMVRVAASQAALSWGTGQLLDRLNGQFDAISCSTYFALRHDEEWSMPSSTTADDIIEALERNIERDNRRFYSEHGDLAREWSDKLGRHIKLIAYEGGQHLADSGQNKPIKSALIAAAGSPEDV